MKLKYKKIILLTTMSTMGIGLLTLSISQDRPQAKESLKTESNQEVSLLMSGNDNPEMALNAQEGLEATPAPTAIPTPSPTPTPLPVYELEENEKIDTFLEDYYAAKAQSDASKIKSMCSDPSQVESLEQLQKKVKYIEDYLNIKSYSKKGIEEGTYIVYAYHEIKFTNINTLAPGLSKLYLVTDDQGNLKIFSGVMSQDEKAYFDARNEDEDVIKLMMETDAKGEAAKASDEDLMIFWDGLNSLINGENPPAEE